MIENDFRGKSTTLCPHMPILYIHTWQFNAENNERHFFITFHLKTKYMNSFYQLDSETNPLDEEGENKMSKTRLSI